MALRAGVIDSGYRGEIFIPITNVNDHTIIIHKSPENESKDTLPGKKSEYVLYGRRISYPYEKAIAQLLLLPIPKVETQEISYDDLIEIKSERMEGALGSSGK